MKRAISQGQAAGASAGPGWFVAGTLPLILFTLFIGIPLVALIVRGVSQEGFLANIGQRLVLDALRLSLVTSAITVIVTVLVGTPLAYYLARVQFKGSGAVDALIELPIVLPPLVAGLGMLMAFGRNSFLGQGLASLGISLPFTLTAVVFAQTFVGAPFYIRSAKLGFEAVDPSLEEIARTLGASPMRVFFAVSLPLASRALIGGLVLCWARAISEFGATIMFAGALPGKTQTMPVAILSALEMDLGSALALGVILMLVSVAVLVAVRLASRSKWRYAP